MTSQLESLPYQSSPGPDGVDCSLWKSTPASAKLLTRIYNTCIVNGKVPDSWKESHTILLYKGGDENQPQNWRPISLKPIIYKIYAALLARHLAGWLTEKKSCNLVKRVSCHVKVVLNIVLQWNRLLLIVNIGEKIRGSYGST